jgi:chaperonin GroES
MKLQPLGDRVLVRRKDEMTETPGGIIIPDSFTEKPMEGEVLAIGEETTKVKVGDNVLFAKFAGVEVMNNRDGMYLLLDQKSILGKIHD